MIKAYSLKKRRPIGVSLYSQPEKVAKDPSDRVLFDYTVLPFFKANKPMNKPEALNLLKVRIKGFRLTPELYADSTITLKDDILTIKKESKEDVRAKSYQLPYPGDKLERYLRPDEWVSSDYKPLHDTGLIYSRNNRYDAFLFSDFLTDYLYNLVRTETRVCAAERRGLPQDARGRLSGKDGNVPFLCACCRTTHPYCRRAGLRERIFLLPHVAGSMV